MKSCKAILVGNGTMGKRHRSRFEACGVQFAAVADNGVEFKDVARKLIADPAGGMLADFAVVASPATTHYAYAKFFLERRIPVFVEKPLATTAEEAQELVDLAAKNDTLLFVAQSECYNPLFLNFRKHFVAELNGRRNGGGDCGGVRLEFRREHRRSERCRDVNVALDLLVHDLSLFFTMFRAQDAKVEWFKVGKKTAGNPEEFDSALLRLRLESGEFRGVVADFYVNRNSGCDVRTISVGFKRTESSPESDYTVSLARYARDGEIEHVPDSLDNEHRFFLKLLAGACRDLGLRAVQNAADCVKIAASR